MDFSSANTMLWEPVIQMGIISIWFLVVHLFREKVKFLKKLMIPTAMLTGFLLLFLRTKGILELSTDLLETIAYHAMLIGTIALALRVPTKGTFATRFLGVKNGAVITSTCLVQALTGLTVSIIFGCTVMPGLFKAAGLALPMAYIPGPSQAAISGGAFQGIGMPLGTVFGSSLAVIGFMVSIIVGIIVLNIFNFRGKLPKQDDTRTFDCAVAIDTPSGEKEIPVLKNIDRLTIQASLIMIIYLATYWVVYFICYALYIISPAISDAIGSLFWGLHFLVGALLAMALRVVLNAFLSINIMKHQLQNNQLLSRIAGAAFDIMMVTGIASMNFEHLVGYRPLFWVMAIIGPFPALFFLYFVCKKFYPDYACEGFFSLYGSLTGGIGSGILLLREVDPDFKTPAATNLMSGTVFGILFGFPALILASIAGGGNTATYVVFVLYIIYIIILLYIILKAGKKNGYR